MFQPFGLDPGQLGKCENDVGIGVGPRDFFQ
jgi:hypothetical protein